VLLGRGKKKREKSPVDFCHKYREKISPESTLLQPDRKEEREGSTLLTCEGEDCHMTTSSVQLNG